MKTVDIQHILTQITALRAALDQELQTKTDDEPHIARVEALGGLLADGETIFDEIEAYLQGWPEERFRLRARQLLRESLGQMRASFTGTVGSVTSSWQAYEVNLGRIRALSNLPPELTERRRRAALETALGAHSDSINLLQKHLVELQDWVMGVRNDLEPIVDVLQSGPLQLLNFVFRAAVRDEQDLDVIEKTASDGHPTIALGVLWSRVPLAEAQQVFLGRVVELTADYVKAALLRDPVGHSRSTAATWEKATVAVREELGSTWDTLSKAINEASGWSDLPSEQQVEFIVKAWRMVNSARIEALGRWYTVLQGSPTGPNGHD